MDVQSAKKDDQVVALTATVEQDKQNVAGLANSALQAQEQLKTALSTLQGQKIAQAKAVQQQSTILAQNQAADKTDTAAELASRIGTLVPDAKSGITTTTYGVLLNPTASYSVTSALEEVPVLTQELSYDQQVLKDDTDALAVSTKVNADLLAQIAGMKSEEVAQQKQAAAELSAEKLKTKKAFRKGFKIGAVVGFIGGLFVPHATL